MKAEIWRTAPPPYDMLIEVSNLGRVRSNAPPMKGRKPGYIYATSVYHNNLCVTITDGGKRRVRARIALMVGVLFCNNALGRPVTAQEAFSRTSKYMIRHKDGDITNCAASNLEWRPREWRHNARPRPSGEASSRAKLTNAQAEALRKEYWDGVEGRGPRMTHDMLGQKYGLSGERAGRIAKGTAYRQRPSGSASSSKDDHT